MAEATHNLVEVVEWVRTHQLSAYAEIVGRWVWLSFPTKPSADVRAGLVAIGFRWNPKRKVWQHPCGHHSTGSPADSWYLKSKYGVARIPEDEALAGAA